MVVSIMAAICVGKAHPLPCSAKRSSQCRQWQSCAALQLAEGHLGRPQSPLLCFGWQVGCKALAVPHISLIVVCELVPLEMLGLSLGEGDL